MRAAISELCTGEPPGELITSAIAAGLPRENAFSMTGPSASSLSCARPPAPIMPARRITATNGLRFRKGIRYFMALDLASVGMTNKMGGASRSARRYEGRGRCHVLMR